MARIHSYALIAALVLLATTFTLAHGLDQQYEKLLPPPFNVLLSTGNKQLKMALTRKLHGEKNQAKAEEATGSYFPVWPFEFNCTLQKINKDDKDVKVTWTKLYYDFAHNGTKFEFFDHYVDANTGKWGATNFVILFINTVIYFVEPKTKTCTIRAKDIPTISPWWLKLSQFVDRGLFREMYSDLWEFPKGTGELEGIQYYHRVGATDATKIPLRSTNQQNDPGVTDYTDFVVGAQNQAHFAVPSYCPPV